MTSEWSPRKLFAVGVAIPALAANVALLMGGYRDLSLYGFAMAAALFCGLYVLLIYYFYRFVRDRFDDWINRSGGPKGPHPLPANDAHLLNRR